jgi:branched-chain amino acid transport system permease protein
MNMSRNKIILYALILAATFIAPFLFPNFGTQLATLWLMIIVALTWDMTGGQMGYNSLGNIFFYGTGMYVAAVISIGLVYDVGDYTNAAGGGIYEFTDAQYFGGLLLGVIGAGIFCSITAVLIGYVTFGLRGPYFAIGTLGVAIAAGELVSNWDWVGGGQGIALPVYPGDLDVGKIFFYFLFAAIGISVFVFVRWLYGTRFGAAINAIRDDEEKADAMGLHAGYFYGGVRFTRRQGDALGTGRRRSSIPPVQGGYLELFSGVAMGCARRVDRRYRGLFPGWRDGLANA